MHFERFESAQNHDKRDAFVFIPKRGHTLSLSRLILLHCAHQPWRLVSCLYLYSSRLLMLYLSFQKSV